MLIGLAGYAGSGKTSVAEAIARINKYPIASFAAALKAKIDPLFPPKTPKAVKRPTYVEYGRAMRSIDPQHWIKELASTFLLSEPSAIIDDVRYANEVAWIKSRGGVVFLIHREGVGPANEEETASFTEMCETYPNQRDVPVIENNSTIEAAAQAILARLKP
jgi:hypothetical protein